MIALPPLKFPNLHFDWHICLYIKNFDWYVCLYIKHLEWCIYVFISAAVVPIDSVSVITYCCYVVFIILLVLLLQIGDLCVLSDCF